MTARIATEADIQEFANKVQGMVQSEYQKDMSAESIKILGLPTISVMMGAKFARIVKKAHSHEVHGSAYAFVELATGNIYKCDGWKRPAKHARGNIFADNPLASCTPYGIVYLRG